jgi:hypothetical protein
MLSKCIGLASATPDGMPNKILSQEAQLTSKQGDQCHPNLAESLKTGEYVITGIPAPRKIADPAP